MNESLAKQLHDLIGNWKESIAHDMGECVKHDMQIMQDEIKELIENNQKETNQNKT